MGPQIIILLHCLINKTEIKRKKDLQEIKTKEPGASEQNRHGRLPRDAVATARGCRARSPSTLDPSRVRPSSCVDKTPLYRALAPLPRARPLSLALCFRAKTGTLARRRSAIAAAPSYPRPIAWTGRCAWVFSTSPPSHASRDAVKLRDDAVPFFDSGPTPSTIPATSGSLRPRRPPKRLRGERANPSDPFPLSVASGIVASVICRGSVVRRPPLPSFRSPVTIRL